MKKRLLSLLLAVAMMVAVLPTAAFAGDEAGTVNSDLRINADGIPYNVSDKTQNQSNQSVSGNGWKYTHGTNSSWLDLGVDSANYNFDLSDQPALSCEVELYSGTISGGTFNEKISVPYSATDACTISGGVFHGPIYFSGSNSNSSASLKVTGGIFTDSANGFYGQISRVTIEGGIFVNDPRTENFRPGKNVYTLAVTDGLKIVTIQHDSQSVAVSLDKIFVLEGTVTESKPLTLTLSDGTSETLTSATSKTLRKALFIEANGKPNIDGMVQTAFSGSIYHSDTWGYDASGSLELFSNFSGSVGPNPVKCDVKNAGTITGGVFEEMVSSYSSQRGTIQGGIFLGNVAANQNIEGGVFVHTQVNGVHTVSSPAELGKIKTITLGNDTVTLDEPVDSFHFGGTPINLSVTLEDGTVYKNIDTSTGSVKLEPKPEEPDYYTVIVEGGEARNERGDILDSEVALTAGEKITLKLLDETQGEMVFSHWDVNNNDTALADELAKKGFDQTAHETTFTMPAHNLTLTAKYRMPEEDAPQDDSFLMTAAAVTGGAVLTGLVVWQGYNIFSQVYLNAHLPEGTAIPANRQQLALLLWNTAGQPEASAASYVFPDVADPDVQTAARWATEQGLFKARKDGTFAPTDSVTTGQVYRAWQKVK